MDRPCLNCRMTVSEEDTFCPECGCELLHEPNPPFIIKNTKKRFGLGTKIGLGFVAFVFIIFVISTISSALYHSDTSTTTVSTTNNPQFTTSQNSSELNQGTITTSEIVSQNEITTEPSRQEINQVVTDSLVLYPDQNPTITVNGTDSNLVVNVSVPELYEPFTITSFVKLDSNNSFRLFKNIFTDSKYSSISKVKITYMEKFTDKYGAVYNSPGFSYTLSRTTAEKIKNWDNVMDESFSDPPRWFYSIMNSSNSDEFYINPSTSLAYYSGH